MILVSVSGEGNEIFIRGVSYMDTASSVFGSDGSACARNSCTETGVTDAPEQSCTLSGCSSHLLSAFKSGRYFLTNRSFENNFKNLRIIINVFLLRGKSRVSQLLTCWEKYKNNKFSQNLNILVENKSLCYRKGFSFFIREVKLDFVSPNVLYVIL